LRRSFNLLDANGDTQIEETEFINAFVKMNPKMDHETALKEATVLFKAADVDNNGSISFSEWCAAGINMQ
jgi:Ca2+-binding EF-hand superfamily protein